MGFFSSLTGKDQAKTLGNANADAMHWMAEHKKAAEGDLNTGYDGAESVIQPYADAGKKGFDAYYDSIGLNGLDGYGRAKTMFDTDPFAEGENEAARLQARGIERKYNALGANNSGASFLAQARAGAERYGGRVNAFRDRLAGVGDAGLGLAKYGAGLKVDRGNALAGLNYGYGGTMANNALQYGNALAGTHSIGINNLMSLAELGVKGATGMTKALYPSGVGK